MNPAAPHPSEQFWFYNSCVGDLTRYIHRYALPAPQATPGYLTNAFGVKVNPKHLPDVLRGREGLEPPPIPANWHTDIAELGAALRAVDLARGSFTAVELGCGWACWLNIAGAAARQRGLTLNLIGIEGDVDHVRFANESLTDNGFNASQFTIHHGIAAAQAGTSLWPRQDRPGASWGLAPVMDASAEDAARLLQGGGYTALRQIPLHEVLPATDQRIDLLHIDIQGGESTLVPNTLEFLNRSVACMLIGTHSRQIEGALMDVLLKAGWVLEVERPAVLHIGRHASAQTDGVQFWRNPALLPDTTVDAADPIGQLQLVECPGQVQAGSTFEVVVSLFNQSRTDWSSRCATPVNLAYHWMDTQRNMVEYDGQRTVLADHFLYAGQSVRQAARVLAPPQGGRYILCMTVVQDGVQWFDRLA